MKEKKFFYVVLTREQIEYTLYLVNYSIDNHTIKDIWNGDIDLTRKNRFTGSIGEVVLADVYGLSRPTKSYGAVDGQDYGEDLIIEKYVVDIKTMNRTSCKFRENWVCNLSERQLTKYNSKTDLYYILNLHKEGNKYIITFLGYIKKEDVFKYGILYKKGTVRKNYRYEFVFEQDTYEVELKYLRKPIINSSLKKYRNKKITTLTDFYIN